jgi:hypothetical protein
VRRNGSSTEYHFPPSKDFDVSDDAKGLISKLLINNPGTKLNSYLSSQCTNKTLILDKRLSVIDAL